jgi:magnesium transporter
VLRRERREVAVLRILVRTADGRVESRTDPATVAADLADRRRLVWVDAEGEPSESLGRLADLFQLHPVTLDDFINRNQRPKVEEFENYLFLVVHAIRRIHDDVVETEELHMVLQRRALLTVHERPLDAVKRLQDRMTGDPASLANGPSILAYHLSDAVVDGCYPFLDALGDEIDVVEDDVVAAPTPAQMQRIFRVKRILVQLRRIVSPQREVYNALSRRDHPFIDDQVAVYFRDIHDHLVRAFEMVDSYRDMIGNILDAYLATVSNRLAQVMKQLTIIATIFMPLSWLTGFFGMNFQALPFDRPWILWAVAAATIAVPAGMLWYFYRQGWILGERRIAPGAGSRERESRP